MNGKQNNDHRGEGKFRLPEWLDDGTKRWRMRVGFHFGKKGRRVERPFYWMRPDNNGGVPPPDVQAEAVERQRRWRKLTREWRELAPSLKLCFPDRDWSQPVWCDEEQAKMKVGEAAGVAQALATATTQIEAEERAEEQQAMRWVTRNGLDALVAVLREPTEPPMFSQFATPTHREQVIKRLEDRRITTLAELAPTVQRRMLSSVTIREAFEDYLAELDRRVALRTSHGIDKDTRDTEARRIYGAFGLSSKAGNPLLRTTPVSIDDPLLSLDKKKLADFASFWHELPEGIDSERTVKNHLESVRVFLNWCEEEDEYGFHLPAASRRLLTASDVEREAEAFDPDKLRKLVVAGGRRGQGYILFGLCFGYYQQDIAETRHVELFEVGGVRYVQRCRSKEDKAKRGRRPLKVRHYIPPEFTALIDDESGTNASGTLFNTEHGTILKASSIHDRWQDVQKRAGVDLMFSQLRKIGYNAIKRLGGNGGPQLAEYWDGHAKGTSDSYDDGVWPELNEIERRWADELREHGILT